MIRSIIICLWIGSSIQDCAARRWRKNFSLARAQRARSSLAVYRNLSRCLQSTNFTGALELLHKRARLGMNKWRVIKGLCIVYLVVKSSERCSDSPVIWYREMAKRTCIALFQDRASRKNLLAMFRRAWTDGLEPGTALGSSRSRVLSSETMDFA